MEYATTTDPKTGKPIVEFQCPSCSTGHRAALADAGSPTSCSRCKAAFRVPGVDDAAKASPSRRAEPPKQAAPPTASAPAPTAARVSDLPPTEYSELIRQAVKSGVLSALVTVVGVLILLGSIFAAVLGVSDSLSPGEAAGWIVAIILVGIAFILWHSRKAGLPPGASSNRP
ncbi:MAG: hypothetical protein AAFR96_06480 [Planctomycetota bacterium]